MTSVSNVPRKGRGEIQSGWYGGFYTNANYRINGEMPFIKDPRGMAATGLVLGIVAFVVPRFGDAVDRMGKAEIALAVVSLALGVIALALAETGAAEVLLAVFMGSILLVWAIELMDHAGALPGTGRTTGLSHR
jgi:hypothetical protein